MVSTPERRVEKLEQGMGNECPRCRNTMIVHGVGTPGEISVTKNGYRLTPEAALKFDAEEGPDYVCPLCQKKRKHIRVQWGPGKP